MGGHAWVTLATNDSYSLGALVLARSLEQVGTRQQLAVLITPGVTNAMRSKLTEVFDVVQEVNLLDSRDEENLRLLKRPELGVTFTKLHCWRLTQFDKCVFLDADTLVLENCDELFDREELSAAPDIGWPDCFNSGVFVFRPSMETFEKLIRFAIEKGSFDGGDQGLLNLYFSDWAHKDISKHLPFIYNVSSTACYSYLPAFKQFGKTAKIIHFIGASKPWLQYFDTETKKVHASEGLKHLQEILQRWWDLFCTIHSSLSPDMAGLAGAFAKLTLGAPRTPEQAALDDHLRRQGWEVGNIDYLGRDSFDNIWSKICETLSTAPEQPIATTESPKVEDKSKVVPPTEGAVKSDEKALPEMEDKQKPASVIAQSQVLTESQIPSEAIAESPTEGSEQVEIPKDAKVATETSSTESPPSFAAVVSATITSETTPVETPKPATPVSLISEPTTPTPVPVVPTPETPVAATPAAVSTAPATPAPVAPAPVTPPPAPVTPAVVTPVTVTPTPVTPAPVTPPPVTPASVAPAAATAAPVPTTVETQVHVIPAAITVAPVTPVPVTPAAEIPATVTPAATPAAVTPAPTTAAATPAPITEAAVVTPAPTTAAATPAPITEAAVTPIPVTPSAVTPPSVTPSAVTPAPVTSAAATPVPVTQAPVAPAPKTPAEVTPLPVTATPVVPAPVTQAAVAAEPVTTVSVSSVPQSPVSVTPSKDTGVVQPATLAKTPIVAVPSSKAADVPLKEVSVPTAGPVAPQSQVPEKSSGPSTPTEAVVLKDPLKTGKISRDPSKKPKEGIQTPKTQVTEPTPPTTPASPQIKDTKPALGVETVVPETPPVPVAESSTAPTPTPRKSNRSDKKTGTKTKK